jgi:hypothetical protein
LISAGKEPVASVRRSSLSFLGDSRRGDRSNIKISFQWSGIAPLMNVSPQGNEMATLHRSRDNVRQSDHDSGRRAAEEGAHPGFHWKWSPAHV